GLPVRRILVQILLEGLLVAGVGAVFGLVLALLSEHLINQFFQGRYDTGPGFVRITRDVALTCVTIAVPLGASATVVASWALLRRGGLRLARGGMRPGSRGEASGGNRRGRGLAWSAWPRSARCSSTCCCCRGASSCRCRICSTAAGGTAGGGVGVYRAAARGLPPAVPP